MADMVGLARSAIGAIRALIHRRRSPNPRDQDSQVMAVYDEILYRDADPVGLAAHARLLRRRGTLAAVRASLQRSREYVEVVRPAADAIEDRHRRLYRRRVTHDELRQELEAFRSRFGTLEAMADALRSGSLALEDGPRPLNVELDVTTQCNLRCVMCYFADARVSARKREDLSVADFSRIAEQLFPLAHRLSLSIGTEPLMNRGFSEFVSIATSYRIPKVYANTNGLLLSDRLVEHMIRCQFHAIAISMDAATPATYERIRVGGRFERVVANIRAINRLKRRLASRLPEVTLTFVMMRSNVRELPRLVELAHVLEVPNVIATHVVPYTGLDTWRESLVHDKALSNRMLDQARAAAARHGIAFKAPENFGGDPEVGAVDRVSHSIERGFDLNLRREQAPRTRCPFPWHFVAIDGYGAVRPCGWWYGEVPVGDIRRQTFDEIWRGDGYRRLRAEHERGELRRACRTCPAAGVGSVNDTAAFAPRVP